MAANWRQSIKDAVSELRYLDDTDTLTHAAIERMSESERNAALQALLRRTVRAERNRLGSSEQGRVVWVDGEDRREADLTPEQREAVAAHREATGEGFLARADELRGVLIEPAGPDTTVSPDEVDRLRRLVGHLRRLHEATTEMDSSVGLLAAEADHRVVQQAYNQAHSKFTQWRGWALELKDLPIPEAMKRHRRLQRAIQLATDGGED